MSVRRTSRPVLVVAVLLGVLSMASSVRAVLHEPGPEVRDGAFGEAGGPRARAIVVTLARGLVAHQRSDGSYEPGPDAAYAYEVERVAGAALATAALAEARRLGLADQVPGLDAALARGLAFIKSRQQETGVVGRTHPRDVWSQVEGTASAVLAFVVADRAEDGLAFEKAAKALARMLRGGVRNGWTRALATMTVARVAALGKVEAFGRPVSRLVDLREVNETPGKDGHLRTTDWNIAEAIARAVLGIRKGRDPFPPAMVTAVLADKPVWSGQGSDCKAWWMEAWLAARSGRGGPWFTDLLTMVEEEVQWTDGLVPGSFYATPLDQSSTLLFAFSEGLEAAGGGS